MIATAAVTLAGLALAWAPQDDAARLPAVVAAEAEHWAVDYLTPPEGAVLEVGGLAWLSDGRLLLSTRRGQLWAVEDPLADDPADARFVLLAEGFHEGLGLRVRRETLGDGEPHDAIYLLQRGELTRMVLTDGALADGRDRAGEGAPAVTSFETVTDDWGLTGHYHEFAFGLPEDRDGQLYVSLNVSFPSPEWWLGKSEAEWRGWLLQVDPTTGETRPYAHGFRSPAGLGVDAEGRLLVTDNQGDWMAAGPVFHVREGGFHGHPAALNWTEEYRANEVIASTSLAPEVPRVPPALWLPYEWSRSAGDMAPDLTGGRFGPFEGQTMLAELTNGHVLRLMLEEVNGVTQGACVLLRQRVGSAYRTLFAEDGTLFLGMTNRGWGGLAPDHGLARVRYTGVAPFEVHGVHLRPGGFELTFTEPLAGGDIAASQVTVEQYDYDYWWEYGSPERHQTEVPVTAVRVSDDRRTLSVDTPSLAAGMVARLKLDGLVGAGGRALLHDEVAYTVNVLADAGAQPVHVNKVVPPPPPRQSGKEGWLRMTYFDALDAWEHDGWQLVDADLDPDDRSRFEVRPGVNALVNVGPDAGDFTSRWDLGSGRYHVEFVLPEGGRSAVYVQGRYGVELSDDTFGLADGALGTGAVMAAADGSSAGVAPGADGYTGAGHWHELEIEFTAPTFDGDGALLSPPRFDEVLLDGTLIHEGVELSGPSAGAPLADASAGVPGAPARTPLVITGTRGPLALRTLEFKPDRGDPTGGHAPVEGDGWAPVLTDLRGWTLDAESAAAAASALREDGELEAGAEPDALALLEEAGWELTDAVLEAGDGPSHLFSPRGDYGDLELRCQVQINEGGDGGVLLRAQPDALRRAGGAGAGYEVQINASSSDPAKTGSLLGLAPVQVEAIPPGTWVDLSASVRDEPEGSRVQVRLNGVLVVDHLDVGRHPPPGHLALQTHHEGSLLRVRDLQVRAR